MRVLGIGGVLTLLLSLISPSEANAQRIGGRVLDDVTGWPLTTTVVAIDTADALVSWAATDSLGRFVLQLPRAARYRLQVINLGYTDLRSDLLAVRQRQTLDVELRMVPSPIVAEAVVVSVERLQAELDEHGFYDRRDRVVGYHLDTDEILDRRPTFTTDLLRGIPGVTVLPSRIGSGYLVGVGRAPGMCFMKVVLDDVTLELAGASIDDYVSAGEVIAVEVYPGGVGAPVKHRGLDAGCGIIMLWTH